MDREEIVNLNMKDIILDKWKSKVGYLFNYKDLEELESIITYYEEENQQLKERINKIEKHVSSLSSVGRGCEIYADVKREILKVVRGDNK